MSQALQHSLYSRDNEKTFLDKILARNEVDAIRELIKKPRLSRSEMLEVLYLIGGTEAKLMNLSSWDRYVLLKFYVWIREYLKVLELFFDYRETLEKKKEHGAVVLSDRCKQMLDNNERHLEHNVKFLVDLYLNIGRTSLSLGGTAFLEPLKNKFEVHYPHERAASGSVDNSSKVYSRG